MTMSPDQADLLLTLYSGTVQDVPVQSPEQLQRLYFKTQLIRVPGVGNEFQKTQNDTYKGEREMSVCEMQRNAVQARKQFYDARKEFKEKIALAKERKVKLSKEILATTTVEPIDVGIGRAYCSLLKKTGVKELAAQTPAAQVPQKDTVKARTDSIRASIEAESKQADTASRVPVSTVAPVTKPVTPPRTVPVVVPKAPVSQAPPPVQPPVRLPDRAAAAPSQGTSPMPITNAQGDTLPMDRRVPTEVIPAQVESARIRLQEALRSLNRYDVEIQKKFALAAACFIFVLLGAPIALRFPRAGVGLTIGVSLVVFGIYYVGLIAGESLARRGMVPPVVSMWIANVVFGVIALILLAKMGKEAGSNRGGDLREMLDNMRYRFKRKSSRSAASRRVPRTSIT
jgi:lipopolysaccharide export system permease protein